MEEKTSYHHIFARNCCVRRIARPVAEDFLDRYHPLKYTNCRYKYGIYISRQGHEHLPEGTLVAVATFSGPRKWDKEGHLVRSYEWVRYFTLPGTRVAGGMGKALQTFLDEVRPDDIMTYVDADVSEGQSYKLLGFREEGEKEFGNGKRSLKLRLKLVDY